jgi:glycosyltransferase involved in cell wall biosynthesis
VTLEPLELQVVLPVFNEVESLPVLWDELATVLDAHWTRVEVIFVDDASTDGSGAWLRALAEKDPRVRYVRLARHAGITAALDAGVPTRDLAHLRHAR